MATAVSVRERFAEVAARVGAAARKTGRSASDVLVVAVTKYAENDQVRELVRMGHQDYAESRVQSLVQRAAMVDEYVARLRTAPGVAERNEGPVTPPAQVRWHMIGHLQRNKAKKAIEVARLIHSVDSLRLAEEVQAIALRKDVEVDVLLQVNCSGEKSKGGVAIPAALHVAAQIDTMVNVNLRGLMTMAPLIESPAKALIEARAAFERCREIFEEIKTEGLGGDKFRILSMGMSGDYEAAIEEGSNLVRIGSALFGDPDPARLHHEGHEADEEDEE